MEKIIYKKAEGDGAYCKTIELPKAGRINYIQGMLYSASDPEDIKFVSESPEFEIINPTGDSQEKKEKPKKGR